jgi:23S rRNA pseudouridine1911/1915/1917 synthase
LYADTQADAFIVQIGKSEAAVEAQEFLENFLHLPIAFVQQLFRNGQVRLGTQRATPETRLQAGQVVRLQGDVLLPPEEYARWVSQLSSMPLDDLHILYEDPHLLVVNKPAGLLIHSDGNTGEKSPGPEGHLLSTSSLTDIVLAHYVAEGEPFHVRHVHRLDKPTTGTVLYAKHGYSARALDAQLAQRLIRRTYFALVRGRGLPKRGQVDAPIGRDRHVSGKYRVSSSGKAARTHYQALQAVRIGNDILTLVQCTLDTGRTHQIRVHMEHLENPVVGDALYGGSLERGLPRTQIALHARELVFTHPYEMTPRVVQACLPLEWYDFAQSVGIQLDKTLLES